MAADTLPAGDGRREMLVRRTAGGLALAVAALAGFVMLGWLTGAQSLISGGAPGATMKFNTAASLMALAVAIMLLCSTSGRGRTRVALIVCAAAPAALAGVNIIEYLADSNIGVDEFVVTDPAREAGLDKPGGMAPQTALAVIMIAAGVVMQLRAGRVAGIGRWLAALAVIGPVVGVFQHASGISTFFTLPGVSQIALTTAIALTVLGIAVVLSAPRGMPIAAVLSPGPGGAMLRRVLPAALLIPFATGVVGVQGLRTGLYGEGVTLFILVVATAILGATATWLVARGLDEVDEERRGAELRLAASEARLRTLIERAPVGIYEAGPTGARLYANPRWAEVAGRGPESADGDAWIEAVHPDDRERVRAAWALALRERSALRERFRYLRPDGTVAWVDGLALPIEAGAPEDDASGWIGSEVEITAQVVQEDELRARARIATVAARDRDPEEVFAVVSEETAHVVGCDIAMVVKREGADGVVVGAWTAVPFPTRVIGSRIALDDPKAIALALNEDRTVARVYGSDGDRSEAERLAVPYLSAAAAPVRVGDEPWGVLAVGNRSSAAFPAGDLERLERFADMVALALRSADTQQRLRELAVTDHLTGLPNVRAFHERLAMEVALANRHDRPLCVVMIDIDLFKNINDTHGHPVGDLVLRDLAERMRTQVRAGELLARVGGEEFAWLMPETELDGARAAAERMRAEVAAEPIAPVGDVTVSAGISRLAPGESPDDFLNRADIALYAAKRGGRDMVVAHGDRAHG